MIYMPWKYETQRFICMTLYEHNIMVMRKLNKDGSKTRMFNHIKTLIRTEVQMKESIKD